MTVFLQQADGALEVGRTFPTLTGVSDLAVADWDQDGRAEIFLLSADERQVGVTRYDANGRVAFPTMIAFEGKPLTMTVGQVGDKGRARLALIVDQDGKRVLITRQADGQGTVQKLAESFKSNPSSLAIHDADQDGLNDLVMLIPYEKIKILRQVAGKDFEELDVAAPGGTVEQPWLAQADVDGDGKIELLLAQKNFLRAAVLKADEPKDGAAKSWSFAVKEQINGVASNSRIVGAAALRGGESAVPALFLMDAERKVLSVSERGQSGVWQITRNLNLPFTDFNELRPVALGDKSPNTIAFHGLNAAAWLPLFGQVWELKETDGYETPIKDGRLTDVVSGDLNQDKRNDLVFLETARNYLDIVIFDPQGKLVPANRWPVFEERTFRNRRTDAPEPREAIIADFTGDGKNDLIIMVHDRLLLYPQE